MHWLRLLSNSMCTALKAISVLNLQQCPGPRGVFGICRRLVQPRDLCSAFAEEWSQARFRRLVSSQTTISLQSRYCPTMSEIENTTKTSENTSTNRYTINTAHKSPGVKVSYSTLSSRDRGPWQHLSPVVMSLPWLSNAL